MSLAYVLAGDLPSTRQCLRCRKDKAFWLFPRVVGVSYVNGVVRWITEPRNQSLRICVKCQGSITDN